MFNSQPFEDQFLPGDMQQKGWPVHNWTLNITNNLMYALIDNSSGQVLDFVNLGGVGSSLPITQVLMNFASGAGLGISNNSPWNTNGANDSPNSPMSEGVVYQISSGAATNEFFRNALNGTQPSVSEQIFAAPFNPINQIVQSCTWQSVNPLVHYTTQELTIPGSNLVSVFSIPPIASLTNNPGRLNPVYNSGAITDASFGLSAGIFQLNFSGVNNLPYAVWASSDLSNWNQIGVALELPPPEPYPSPWPSILPRGFQFNDLCATNYPARFYQVRLP